MKVQLIVVQGKPEGKVIPLLGPVFKIGRGETCHLRPNSERVSREHAEFTVSADKVVVRDLGSRNGTLVNGKALTQPYVLKDRDLVQVGPLTFMVSLVDAPEAVAAVAVPPVVVAPAAAVAPSPFEGWGSPEDSEATAGPRGSETIMIPAFFDAPAARGEMPMLAGDEYDSEYERHPVVDGETALDIPAVEHPEPSATPTPPSSGKHKPMSKPADKGGTDGASEILRRMMERGRAAK